MKASRSVCASLAVAVLMLSGLSFPATEAAVPHAILGYVRDEASNPILGATVYVNNTRSGDSLDQITDIFGRYTVDIDAYPNGYIPDTDVLSVTAVYYKYSASQNITVDYSPLQSCNVTLPLRTFIVQGKLTKPDSSDARYFNVAVRNEDRNETKTVLSDNVGYYRIDMSAYAGGFQNNDGVKISVNQGGFGGEMYSVISPGPGMWMNMTLADTQNPVPTIQEAPESVNLSQSFRILAWVTDNHLLSGVKLFIRKAGEPLYSEMSMIADDGAANDWNGNGMANFQLYGLSTSTGIPVQTDIGDLQYYISARDYSGNVATLPAADPQSNPLIIRVIDPVMPSLTHAPIAGIEAGVPRNILATADDNIGIDTVQLMLRGVGEPAFSGIEMEPTGDPKQYNANIPAQAALGTLRYYLVCNDTSNNMVRLPAAGDWSVSVADTEAPIITHTKINSARLNGAVNFTCAVSDVLLDAVWLNYSYGAVNDNLTMDYDAVFGNWYCPLNTLATPDNLYYTIWANDTSGNLAKVSHAFPVLDVDVPMIFHEPPAFIEAAIPADLTAYVEDNAAVTNVTLAYLPPGEAAYIQADMDNIDATVNAGYGNYSVIIPAQDILGPLRYIINATDGTNPISWPSLSPYHEVGVTDTLPPVISALSYANSTPSGSAALVSVNVTDLQTVSYARLYFLNSTSSAWAPIDMALNGTDRYECSVPAHPPGKVMFYIASNDSSGNSATLPEAAPKLNPFIINFTDDSPPEIVLTLPESMQVNRTANVRVSVTDDVAVESVELHFKGVQDTGFTLIQLVKTGDGEYNGTLSEQALSGSAQIYASASDGENSNATVTFDVSVINNLPVIRHTSPEVVKMGTPFSLVAEVTDDLHVENVLLSYHRLQGQDTVISMNLSSSGFYSAELSFSLFTIVYYRITAHDAEGSSVWPETGYHEILITDMEFPSLHHVPLANLTVDQIPIFRATVTDDIHIASVELCYRNSTSDDFIIAAMSPVSGTDDFAVMLDRQPEGNLTYFIWANDGINLARSPNTGYYTVAVTDVSGSSWVSTVLLVIVIMLMLVAALLVFMYIRRKKSIK